MARNLPVGAVFATRRRLAGRVSAFPVAKSRREEGLEATETEGDDCGWNGY